MSTKVVTGKVRFSYVNVFAPRASEDGGEPKYSLTILIPKSDTATLNKIKAAIAEARDTFCERNGANSLPVKPLTPLHDGDGMKPTSGEPYGPECKGCYVHASINFYGYSNKRKGIGAGLQSLQKLHDGNPLGGSRGSADDFDDGYSDGDDDGFMD